jgi:hypothetical protein
MVKTTYVQRIAPSSDKDKYLLQNAHLTVDVIFCDDSWRNI